MQPENPPKLKLFGIEEGATCFRDGCVGTMVYTRVEGCTCHCGNPPCSACTRQLPTCDKCGGCEEDDE